MSSIRILEGHYDDDVGCAVLIRADTMTAFGPVFDDGEEAEQFLEWFVEDHRDEQLESLAAELLTQRLEEFRTLNKPIDYAFGDHTAA